MKTFSSEGQNLHIEKKINSKVRVSLTIGHGGALVYPPITLKPSVN